MPARKKAAVVLAVLAGLGLVSAGALLVDRGQAARGLAVIAAAALAGSWALHAFWVRFDLSGASLRRGRRDRELVALTFDDGPGPDTPAV
ncbi:MAG TPA: polysaccharide deacetylase family protein, partial [Anaeromyxobacteraceae bacterium]